MAREIIVLEALPCDDISVGLFESQQLALEIYGRECRIVLFLEEADLCLGLLVKSAICDEELSAKGLRNIAPYTVSNVFDISEISFDDLLLILYIILLKSEACSIEVILFSRKWRAHHR